jgi:hypothetical protein
MRPPDASSSEMPGIPFPGRPGGEHDEPLLDMLFGVRVIPPDAPPEMHDLARMLAALAGPADPSELAGEAAAVAEFSRFAAPAGLSPRAVSPGSARHRLSRRPVRHRLSRRRAMGRAASRRPVRRTTAVKALLGAVVMVGAIAAAYTGALPGPIQKVAHITINAPAPSPPGTRHPAVKPGRDGHARPRPVPHSQPAPPPTRAAARSTPRYGWPGRTPAPPRASASPSCGPGPWQPQDLPARYPSAPSGSVKAFCPASAAPAASPEATGSPSWPAKTAPKAAQAPARSARIH